MIVDIIIIAIILLSVFLGYRKGLVKLRNRVCAFFIAIIITFILYRPIASLIINNTQLDENIQNAITDSINNFTSNEENKTEENSSELVESAKNGMLSETSRELAINIIYGAVMILLYAVLRIALIFISFIADKIAELPILKQFNKTGGIIYGLLRGVLIIYVLLMLIGVFGQVNPNNSVHMQIEDSYLGKLMYDNNILNIFFS